MAFQFGIPKKLIQRVTEIEIDTHYYDKDVIPSAQEIFTFTVNKENKTAVITGLVNGNTIGAVIPYQIQYDQTSQELLATVTELNENCFLNNNALKTITIPNTIHVIPSNCFKNCTALESINIPTSIHTIKTNAFNNCDKLSTVFIPHGVNTIESGAFLECDNLKILCYKHSVAESYAIENNIPYSLISYTIDEDATENSENLVTSGIVHKHVKNLTTKIDNHIDNKVNPHDDANFKNIKLSGTANIEQGIVRNLKTNIEIIDNEEVETIDDEAIVNKKYVNEEINKIHNPDVGSGYQPIVDNSLETEANTIPSAINEINAKVHTITGRLIGDEWNTVSLNKKYPMSWTFLNKPYCYTDDGISVDYRINNKRVVDDMNAFDIYVPINCNYSCSTTPLNEIAGYPVDYLLVNYYYTGNDGKDLDTVTGIENTNWPSSLNSTVGYAHGNSINYNGVELIRWGGDNTGGGGIYGDTKFYESIYFNLTAIQNVLPDEDIDVILYGTWYSEKLNGHINVEFKCYESETIPSIDITNKVIILTGATETYTNNDMSCSIVTKKGSAANYKETYTPAFKITFKKSTDNSNYRTIKIQSLS